jgi:hypothetical protein
LPLARSSADPPTIFSLFRVPARLPDLTPARGVSRADLDLPEERTMNMFSLWYLNKYANAMCAALKLI